MILLKSGLDKSREYLGAPLSAHEMGLLSTQSGPPNVVQLVNIWGQETAPARNDIISGAAIEYCLSPLAARS
jgi:hypothetical protein